MITVVGAAHCFRSVVSEISKTFTTLLYINMITMYIYIYIYLKLTHDVPHALFEQMTQTFSMGVGRYIST